MSATITSTREEQVRRAFFHGAVLTLANSAYLQSVRAILEELLRSDLGAGDLTAKSLQLDDRGARASVLAKEHGISAGIDEFVWLYARGGMHGHATKRDGDAIAPGDALLEIHGRRGDLLACERVGLNLLQRMSGIATAAPSPSGRGTAAQSLRARRSHPQDPMGLTR